MADNPLETGASREQRIREQAYHLWQADGQPHGRDHEYWERAAAMVATQDSEPAVAKAAAAPAAASGKAVAAKPAGAKPVAAKAKPPAVKAVEPEAAQPAGRRKAVRRSNSASP